MFLAKCVWWSLKFLWIVFDKFYVSEISCEVVKLLWIQEKDWLQTWTGSIHFDQSGGSPTLHQVSFSCTCLQIIFSCTCLQIIVSCTCLRIIFSCTCLQIIVSCTCQQIIVSCTWLQIIVSCICLQIIVSCTCLQIHIFQMYHGAGPCSKEKDVQDSQVQRRIWQVGKQIHQDNDQHQTSSWEQQWRHLSINQTRNGESAAKWWWRYHTRETWS